MNVERPSYASSTLGLVIPAYQPDVDRLSGYVYELRDQLSPDEIRIELDSPSDGVADAASSLPATVNVVPCRRGKGAAITAGFEALSTDVLAFVDADGATPAASVIDVVDPALDGAVEVAVGSRRHPDALVRHDQRLLRRLLGDTFQWMARRLLPVELYDYQCGTKAITARAWRTLRDHIHERGFAWDIELLAVAWAHGAEIREVPVTWRDRPGSTVDPIRNGARMFRSLLAARHLANVIRQRRVNLALERLLSVSDRRSIADEVDTSEIGERI